MLDDEESDTEHSSSEKHVEQNQTKDYEQMVVDNDQGNEFNKFVILQSIGIIVMRSKETTVVTYTCTYSSGH